MGDDGGRGGGGGVGTAHKRTLSRLVGPGLHDDGTRTTVYEALVPLACGHCGRVIAPGALFTRHSVHVAPGVMVHMPTQVPVCAACRPVHLAPPT